MDSHERNPKFLIAGGYLERCENFHHRENLVQAERLGYRITKKFVKVFAGRVFSSPHTIFSDEMLRPEKQDMDIFAASMATIVDAHRRAALLIGEGQGIGEAIPPLQALLRIAIDGECDGMTLRDEKFRAMFTREAVIGSDWYLARLKKYQQYQIEHLANGLSYVAATGKSHGKNPAGSAIDFEGRERAIAKELEFVKTDSYVISLIGTLGQ